MWEPVEPGDLFSHTITYLNLGRSPATGVVLTETISPAAATVHVITDPTTATVIVWELGAMAPREEDFLSF